MTMKMLDREWLYFAAGALLPSLAFFFLRPTVIVVEGDTSDDDSEDEINQPTEGGPSSSWSLMHAPYKMILVVNQELPMGKGKMAAQCCHAAVGCYKRAAKQCPNALVAWERTGCAKIAVKCPTQEEMELIAAQALSADVPVYLVEDAGRTQIAAGSRTVLGLFGPASVFEGLTNHLKLM